MLEGKTLNFTILCESALNTGTELEDEPYTWFDLTYKRLSAHLTTNYETVDLEFTRTF